MRKSRALNERVDGIPQERGGDEHILLGVKSDPERIYKTTFGDNLGCYSRFWPSDPELTGKHFHAEGNANPFLYLKRWLYLNAISEFQTRYEGILPPQHEGHLPLICISQPMLRVDNPTRREIEAAFRRYKYFKISEDAFLNPENKVLLTDAAPRNIRVIDGAPVPFDAIAERASEKIVTWATSQGRIQ